jgi:phage shock protein PspC (stress-responsive transcriptional regulator)
MEDTTPTPSESTTPESPADTGATIGPAPETTAETPEPPSGDVLPPTTERTSARRRYIRPREGRIIAGVAAGLAAELGISVTLVRVVLAVTAIFGGLGLATYLAAWALMPDEAGTRSAADAARERLDGTTTVSGKVGLGLIGVGGIIVLASLGVISSPIVVAGLLVVAGIALMRPRTT